jgi:hypothetical protein
MFTVILEAQLNGSAVGSTCDVIGRLSSPSVEPA